MSAAKIGSRRMSRAGSYLSRLRRAFTWPASRAGRILFCLIVSPLRLLALVVLLLSAAAHAGVDRSEPPPGLTQRAQDLLTRAPSPAKPLCELPIRLNHK